METVAKKSRWIGGLLNLVLPGAGLLYLGKPFLALLNFVVAMCLVVMLTQGFPINDPWWQFKLALTFVISGLLALYHHKL